MMVSQEIDRYLEDVAVRSGDAAPLASTHNLEQDVLRQVLGQRAVLDPAQKEGHQRTLKANAELSAQLLGRRVIGNGIHRYRGRHRSTRLHGIEAVEDFGMAGVLLN